MAKKFDVNEMECIAENAEKYISFPVPIKAEVLDKGGKPVRVVKNGKEEVLAKKCMLRFIDSCQFMQSSLSNLVDNLAGTNTDIVVCNECKDQMEFLEIDSDYVAQFKCKTCHSSHDKRQLDADALRVRFAITYRCCGGDEFFRLMLRKSVYPYEYMDSFSRFDETELPSQEMFYRNLKLCGISKNDYTHAQKVWEKCGYCDLGDYYDLYLCSDALLLADVFEGFRDVCKDIYGLDPAHFYTAPGLVWQAALKITGVQLELLAD